MRKMSVGDGVHGGFKKGVPKEPTHVCQHHAPEAGAGSDCQQAGIQDARLPASIPVDASRESWRGYLGADAGPGRGKQAGITKDLHASGTDIRVI